MKIGGILLCLVIALSARADVLRIAVASNFEATLEDLADAFEQRHDIDVQRSPGSTGRHFAQICHGAPFDLFFAADMERPRLLEEQGRIVEGTRFTYALGKLVLWSPDPERITGKDSLNGADYRHLAIANPKLAPYGKAALDVLENFGLADELRSRLVMGSNIGQTAQFVHTGAAEMGFVALSQIQRPGKELSGSSWLPPDESYSPIIQQAVVLKESAAARAFIAFLATEEALEIIASYGYGVPYAVPGRS